MKSGVVIIATGVIMVACGLILFYAVQSSPQIESFFRKISCPESLDHDCVQSNPQIESFFRTIKHAGTFIGLLGIGVTLAGILLYLINRNQPQIQDFDVK